MPARYAQDLPKVGKGAVVRNIGLQYTIEQRDDYPVPACGKGDLLLKLTCTGLCMSDHHYMAGDWGENAGQMICDCAGHEGAGIVVGIGEDVPEGLWKLGDRAGIKPLYDVCRSCDHCLSGHETVCDRGPYIGMHMNGSYAQYLLSPAFYTSRIPDGVSDEVAGPLMCSGATVFAALKRARLVGGLQPGEWVVVLGAGGGVGSMCVTFAHALGYRVVGIDTGDDKKNMVSEMGCEHFVDFMSSKNMVEEVTKVTNGGAHAVICCGGSAASYKGATDYVRKRGVVVCVGLPPAGALIESTVFLMCVKKLHIIGSIVGSLSEIDGALDLAARKKIKPYITVYPWKDFVELQKQVVATKVTGRICIRFDDDVKPHRVEV